MNTSNCTQDQPFISVIIATYNRSEYIAEAIDSVIAQSWTNFELLVVDDGSTDQTQAILSSYENNPRITISCQANQGRAAAFNSALDRAKGEYIAVLDSDNRWVPERLMKGVEAFRAYPDAHIIYGDCILIDEKGVEFSRKNMRRFSGRITKKLWRDNSVSINTALVRRQCFEELGGMDPERRRADDYELWLRFSTRFNFRYIPEYLAEYRVMEDQISSDKRGRFEANEQILTDFQRRFSKALSRSDFEEGWAFFFTRKARYYASQGFYKEAWTSLLRALRHKFFYSVPWRGAVAIAMRRPEKRI